MGHDVQKIIANMLYGGMLADFMETGSCGLHEFPGQIWSGGSVSQKQAGYVPRNQRLKQLFCGPPRLLRSASGRRRSLLVACCPSFMYCLEG